MGKQDTAVQALEAYLAERDELEPTASAAADYNAKSQCVRDAIAMLRNAPHRIEHDFWMTHPDDVDYLAPADRWCRVCARPDREHVCTTCGRRADDPYRNQAAGEGCVDRIHDAFVDRQTGAVL